MKKEKEVDRYIISVQTRIKQLFTLENVIEIAHAGYVNNPTMYQYISKAYIRLEGFVISLESNIGVIMRIFWESEQYANIHNEFGEFNMITAIKKMEELGLIEK